MLSQELREMPFEDVLITSIMATNYGKKGILLLDSSFMNSFKK